MASLRLAQLNVARLVRPFAHPRLQPSVSAPHEVNAAADEAPGLV